MKDSVPAGITRRDAIVRVAFLMGGAIIGGSAFLRGGPRTDRNVPSGFTPGEIELLDEIGDTIIPATDTPGAGAVGIGLFMAMMVNDCYDDLHRGAFKAGLVKVEDFSRERSGKNFIAASAHERTAMLNELDAEQRKHSLTKPGDEPAHYFRMMKQLTLLGYFTSEAGATQALRFVEVPGRYDGNVLYKKGDRNWYSGPSRFL